MRGFGRFIDLKCYRYQVFKSKVAAIYIKTIS